MSRKTASLRRFLEPSLALELAPLGRIEHGRSPLTVDEDSLLVLWRPGAREASVRVKPARELDARDDGDYLLATYEPPAIATRRG